MTFASHLLFWFDAHKRDLPWRKDKDPYAVWVSEVMLQQTRVDTVRPYYARFMKAFPEVADLAAADPDHLLKLWEGLGYYSRARNLQKSAKRIVEEMDGRLPTTHAGLLALSGVGDYIASAVSSICFDHPEPVVDGNVKRVLSRILADPSPVNLPKTHKAFRNEAGRLMDTRRAGDFNQAMMELGALICTPRNPECGVCPVRSHCVALKEERVLDFPVKEKKPPVPFHEIACGVLVDEKGRLLVTKRAADGFLGGFWEFPGGKRSPGEPLAEACRREFWEETGLSIRVIEPFATIRHAYSHFRIELAVFWCRLDPPDSETEVKLNGPVDFRWISAEELDTLAFPGANRKFIPKLQESLYAGSIPE